VGRRIPKHEPVDFEEVLYAAKEHNVGRDLDAQPQRLDLNDVHLHRARELGVTIAPESGVRVRAFKVAEH
jgi:DNA polymerase (family X)